MEEKCKIGKYILIAIISIAIIIILVLIIPIINEIAFEGSDDIEPYTEEELFDMGIDKGMWVTKGQEELYIPQDKERHKIDWKNWNFDNI